MNHRIILNPEWEHKPRVRSAEELTKDANHAYSLLRQFQSDNNLLRSQLLKAEEKLARWEKISWTVLLAVAGEIAKEVAVLLLHH